MQSLLSSISNYQYRILENILSCIFFLHFPTFLTQHVYQTLKGFLVGAEAEVRSLTSLYSSVVCLLTVLLMFSQSVKIHVFEPLQGRNADALALYFGEDPARCPFEQGKHSPS